MPGLDAEAKVRGRAAYVDDVRVTGLLHACAVRSWAPHLALERIDRAPALALPGVRAVLTAADVPGRNVVPLTFDDWPLLAADVARHHGEALALVAAETAEAARTAAALVVVEARELPSVTDLERAQEPDQPLVTVLGGERNLFARSRRCSGDVATALGRAAVVVEGTYRTPCQEHAYLEPQGALACLEHDGSILVRGSMQCPAYVQRAVAAALGWPLCRVRVTASTTGGAFGGKEEYPCLVAAHAALLAVHTGRPVKMVLDRHEDLVSTTKRHPAVIHMVHGADRRGRLCAVRCRLLLDAGAYAGVSASVLARAVHHAVGPYRCDAVDVEGCALATHRVPSGAFRGFGQVQVAFAGEAQMDRLAEELALDPVELRALNGLTSDSGALAPVLRRAAGRARWASRRRRLASRDGRPAADGLLHGIGVSCSFYGVGLGPGGRAANKADALVQVHADGSVALAVGTTDMGQGAGTALAQLAAEGLGCRYDDVRVLATDTSVVGDSGPTAASRTTVWSGNAVLRAAETLRGRLHGAAAGLLQCEPEDLGWGNGRIFVRRAPGRSVDFAAAARACAQAAVPLAEHGFFVLDTAPGAAAYPVYTFGAHVVEVTVDPWTAAVRVVRAAAVFDVVPVNPSAVVGQVQGGVMQGLGLALTERFVEQRGVVLSDTLARYQVPGTGELPALTVDLVPAAFAEGPFGAKGVGEAPIIGVAPAIASAVAMATGWRPRTLPVLPEDLLPQLAERPWARSRKRRSRKPSGTRST